MDNSYNTIIRESIILLPFTKEQPEDSKKPHCFWHVIPTSDDYQKQMEQGQLYALQALHVMKEKNLSPLLSWCVLDMPRYGEHTGVEVGFLNVFAKLAMSN